MNKTKLPTSMDDTSELRNLIIENPDMPILCFVGEEAYNDEFPYSQADIGTISIKELTLYGDYWITRDDAEDRLSDDLCEDYDNLSDEEYDQMIKKKVNEMEFVIAIVMYVG